MKETQFIQQNQEKWQRFEKLNASKTADPEEISQLYLDITEDLSYAQTHYQRRTVRVYLNQLAQKVFIGVNRFKRDNLLKLLREVSISIPLEIFRSRKTLTVAFVASIIYIALGALSTAVNPDFPRWILGDYYVDMTIQNIESGNPLKVYEDDNQLAMFIRITTNNLGVALLTFFIGYFFSFGSHILLFTNGIMLGAFQYFFYQRGLFVTSFLGIWIHGAFEISAILIAGGAGITAGNGFLFPGRQTRFQSMQQGLKRGLKIILLLVPFIIAAGYLESYVTHHYQVLPNWTKWMIIGFSFCIMFILFVAIPIIVGLRYKHLVEIEQEALTQNQADPELSSARVLQDFVRDSFFYYGKKFTSIAGVFIAPSFFIGLVLLSVRAFFYPDDLSLHFYYYDWISHLNFITGTAFSGFLDYLISAIWLLGLTLSTGILILKLNSVSMSLKEFSKRVPWLLIVGLVTYLPLLVLPWYLQFITFFLLPFALPLFSSVMLGENKFKTIFLEGIKLGYFGYFNSIFVLAIFSVGITVLAQPIAAIFSVFNEYTMRPELPDLLDVLCDFLTKIFDAYKLDSMFWTNWIREIVYLTAVVFIVPLLAILSTLIYHHGMETKNLRGLWKEFEKFGKRSRTKESMEE